MKLFPIEDVLTLKGGAVMKRLLDVLIMICIAIPVVIFSGGYYLEKGLPWDASAAKKMIQTELEARYGESFELKSMRFDLLHGGGYYTTATSTENGTEFYVSVTDDVMEESYGYEYWSNQVNKDMLHIIQQHYPEISYFESAPMGAYENLPLQQQIQTMTWPVYIDAEIEITEGNKQEHIQKAYDLFEQLQTNYTLASFFIGYGNRALQIREEHIKPSLTFEEFQTFFKTYDETY